MDNANLNAVVVASNLDNQKPSSLMLGQSHGWLKSAEWIAVGASATEPHGSVFHALPALFALYHGIELFLKGVTCELAGSYKNNTHDLVELQNDYDTSTTNAQRPELRIKANIKRFIDWDQACRPSRKGNLPRGSDLRFILDHDDKPSWPGVSIGYQDLVDWSREYRRDFARVRRLLFNVKGWSAFWEEGTFASLYPTQPLWFFCFCGGLGRSSSTSQWQHVLTDTRGRNWVAYEGEAINSGNFFINGVGKTPEPNLRIECALRDLPTKLADAS